MADFKPLPNPRHFMCSGTCMTGLHLGAEERCSSVCELRHEDRMAQPRHEARVAAQQAAARVSTLDEAAAWVAGWAEEMLEDRKES